MTTGARYQGILRVLEAMWLVRYSIRSVLHPSILVVEKWSRSFKVFVRKR